MSEVPDKTLRRAAAYLRILATIERAEALGEHHHVWRLCQAVDSIEVAHLAEELTRSLQPPLPDPVCFHPESLRVG